MYTKWFTGETRNQINLNHAILVFGEREKPECPGKNLSKQSRESTSSTHIDPLHKWQPKNILFSLCQLDSIASLARTKYKRNVPLERG